MSYIDLANEFSPQIRRKLTYNKAYRYWYALLANKVISLFDWKGLPFAQHELEIYTQLTMPGYCGVVEGKDGALWVVHGSGVGVTEYPDKWTRFVWACPLGSGTNEIGKGAVLSRNNSLLLSTRHIIEHYSHMLAHTDLSVQAQLINSRSTGYSLASNDTVKNRIKKFYEALEDGKTEVILTESDLNTLTGAKPVEFLSDQITGKANSILDYWQVGQNILKDFYTTIGISKPTDKRERLITDEIAQEEPLFKFNVEDMLDQRQKTADELNRVFGLNVSVDLAESLKKAITMTEGGAINGNDSEV